jgi:amino acid transporter
MAYVFGQYANELIPLDDRLNPLMLYGAIAIVVLTGINIFGVRQGTWTQNLLTVIKVLGLATVFVVGMVYTAPDAVAAPAAGQSGGADYRLALILILYAFGGWNEMAYVGAEVRDPNKNILRALVLGTIATTAVYVLVTLAFVHALGLEGTRHSDAVAADVLRLALGEWGSRLISLLICVLALGVINGMIFTGARIYYALGTEHRLYAWLGQWSGRRGTPVWSLLIQCLITLGLVIGFGWSKGQEGLDKLVNFTTPVFWIFFLLIGTSLFVLRFREPNTPRPYRTAGYPVVPLLFCLSCLFMLWASVTWALDHKSYEAIWAIALLVIGVALCFFDPQPKDGKAAG